MEQKILLEQKIKDLRSRAGDAINSAESLKELDEVRVKFLGKKGELTLLRRSMGQIPAEDRPKAGQMINEVVAALTEKINSLSADGSSAETTAAAAELQKLLTELKQAIPAKEV